MKKASFFLIGLIVSKIAREKRYKFGRETFEASPDKGYSAVSKTCFYGYKLHSVTSVTRFLQHGFD